MVLTAYTAASIWLASARTRMSWYSACSSAVSPAVAAVQSVGVMAGWGFLGVLISLEHPLLLNALQAQGLGDSTDIRHRVPSKYWGCPSGGR